MAEEQEDTVAQTVTVIPSQLAPHRGVVILILGICGLGFGFPGCFCCGVLAIIPLACGIVAWIMGKNDLREMAAGRIDPSGEGLTKAGKICGIISVILAIVALAISLILILVQLATLMYADTS